MKTDKKFKKLKIIIFTLLTLSFFAVLLFILSSTKNTDEKFVLNPSNFFNINLFKDLSTDQEYINTQLEIVETATKQQDDKKYPSVISVEYLRTLNIDSDKVQIEQELSNGFNYKRYIASYKSQGYKIYGLLTVPNDPMPNGGYSAIVFNHGYIPPTQYVTTQKYVAYVDYLARNGFVVFKIDLRGHGKSEGTAFGSYFSNAYSIDAISALKSLQKYEIINKDKIGMWGHSMAGNLVLRSMLMTDQIKAGVIWAGAVYSYKDFAKYKISDNSFMRRSYQQVQLDLLNNRETSLEIQKIRENPSEIDFENEFWSSISLTKNLNYLSAPLQLHHSIDDNVTNIGYSKDLAKELDLNGKKYEFFEYSGGGHNINSPYFETAIKRTAEFFKLNL